MSARLKSAAETLAVLACLTAPMWSVLLLGGDL